MRRTALLGAVHGLLAVHPVTLEAHEAGLRIAERYGFSVYDAMIVASAIEVGCDILWSEDMQGGMVLEEGLRIVNPFA
jgi:predicted nucleic acid-binding protein